MNKQNSFSNKTIEALKMAIEELEYMFKLQDAMLASPDWGKIYKACKEALAEAEKQEIGEAEIRQMLKEIEWCHQELEKQEWQSLSDDNILKLFKPKFECEIEDFELIDFARAIEQSLKELNAKK